MSADTPAADAPADAASDGADAGDHPMVGQRHDEVELPVIRPAIARDEVDSSGRVGAVAYPYRVYEAEVEVDRPLMSPRRDRRVISVDCSRRLSLRADTVPEFETRTVEDALVLPSELSPEQADEKARDAAFKWTLRTSILGDVPEVELARTVDAYKLFWLVERPDGDCIVDSVDGSERPLDD
ncbi:hypothetical protein M0R89_16045 [Halorussus limi]|uniref:Uncharacterized protein n=1 Tax=Halorussus limi TaxID=2938695 RepID=A0A8U0HT27_9EURY|nr:hypothetical protein [Halorussus limi]UPV74037.1 hypothetical protein M0R89_16045 [Halorussus limi]